MGTVIVFWLVLSILVGVLASTRGRSGIGFFLLSLVVSPLLGLILILILEPNQSAVEARKLRAGDSKKCPYCAELIRAEAVVCRFCGKEQEQEAPAAEPDPQPAEPEPEQPLITDQYKPKVRGDKRRRAGAGTSAWAAVIWLVVAGAAALILITAATR